MRARMRNAMWIGAIALLALGPWVLPDSARC